MTIYVENQVGKEKGTKEVGYDDDDDDDNNKNNNNNNKTIPPGMPTEKK